MSHYSLPPLPAVSSRSWSRGTHANNSHQTLGAKAAAALDKELMSTGAFSLDQLMELAGLSVSQAGMVAHVLDVHLWGSTPRLTESLKVYRVHPPSSGRRILVACGPGNNGSSPVSVMGTSSARPHTD